MAETFNYTREWTDEKAFPLLGFSRDWNNPEDYPTVELDERKVREDMQSLHDEVKNYLNEQLIPAVIAEEATVEDWAHAESLRTEAENGRASAEEDRTSAEAARVLAEQGRTDAEAARAAAEQARVDSTTGVVAQAAEQAQAAGVSAQASENSAKRAGQSASGAAASQESAALHDANAKAWAVGGSVGEETDKGVFYTMVDGAQYYSELAKMYAAGGAKPDGVEPSDGIRHDGAANLAQKAAAFAHGGSYKTYDMYGNLNTVTVAKGAKQYAADAEAARDAAQAATANTATKDLSNVSDADFLAKAESAGVGGGEGGGGGSDVFIAQYGVTTNAEIEAAYMARKCVLCVINATTLRLVLRHGSADHIFAGAFYDLYMEVEVKNDVWTTPRYESYVPASHASTHAPGGSDPLTGYASTAYVDEAVANAVGGGGAFYAKYGVTTSAEIEAAYQAGKVVLLWSGEFVMTLTRRANATVHNFLYFNTTAKQLIVCICESDKWRTSNFSLSYLGVASIDYVDQAVANAGGGATVYEATIGTSWTEDGTTGVKTQTVAISGVTAANTAKVDHRYAGDGTSEGYAAFVEEENQYLTCITNGFAETVAGGIKFTIFGDSNTVNIPIVVEVV